MVESLSEIKLSKYPQIVCNKNGIILHINDCAADKFRINLVNKAITDFMDDENQKRFKSINESSRKFEEYKLSSLIPYSFVLSENIRSKPIQLYKLYLFRDRRSVDVVKSIIKKSNIDVMEGIIRESQNAHKKFRESFDALYYGDYAKSGEFLGNLDDLKREFVRLYRDNSLLAINSKIPYNDYSERHLYKIYPIMELIMKCITDEIVNLNIPYNIRVSPECEAIIEHSGFIIIVTTLISILAEVDGATLLNISAQQIGNETEFLISCNLSSSDDEYDLYNKLSGIPENHAGDMQKMINNYPESSVRISLCQTLAGYAGYGFDCIIKDNCSISFFISTGIGEIYTENLKSPKIFVGLDYTVKQAVNLLFPHEK